MTPAVLLTGVVKTTDTASKKVFTESAAIPHSSTILQTTLSYIRHLT
jgi:hypothetical protein